MRAHGTTALYNGDMLETPMLCWSPLGIYVARINLEKKRKVMTTNKTREPEELKGHNRLNNCMVDIIYLGSTIAIPA